MGQRVFRISRVFENSIFLALQQIAPRFARLPSALFE